MKTEIPPSEVSTLKVENIGVTLPALGQPNHTRVRVLEGFSFEMLKPQIVAVYGPNGTGKTTFLRVLAGLQPTSGGTVLINGKHPAETRVAMVFQNYRDSLLPWYTAAKNLSIACGRDGSVSRRDSVLDNREQLYQQFLGKDFPFLRKPPMLSGGEQQRLCLVRAFSRDPEILLLDEPYSALDYQSKRNCQAHVERYASRTLIPIILVTHDIRDALILADRIIVVGASPLKVVADISVPIDRPRSYEMFEDKNSICWEIEATVTSAVHRVVSRS